MARPGFEPTTSRSRGRCSTTEPAGPVGRTEAIRTQLQSSKSKWEITNITNSQTLIQREHMVKPSEQLFPKRLPLSNRNRIENNKNTRKVKRHRNSDTKNR